MILGLGSVTDGEAKKKSKGPTIWHSNWARISLNAALANCHGLRILKAGRVTVVVSNLCKTKQLHNILSRLHSCVPVNQTLQIIVW